MEITCVELALILMCTSLWQTALGAEEKRKIKSKKKVVNIKDLPEDVYNAVDNVELRVLPPNVLELQEGSIMKVSVNVSLSSPFPEEGIYILRADLEDLSIAKLTVLKQLSLSFDEPYKFYPLSIVGLRLGKTKLKFYVANRIGQKLGTRKFWVSYSQDIHVLRNVTIATSHVHVISHAIVAINMVVVGTKMEKEDALNLIKRPLSLTVGFICRFGVLPGTVILLSDLFHLEALASSGLLVLAIMQAEAASVLYVMLMDGDLALGLMMTFIFGLAGLGFAPLWFLIKETYINNSSYDLHVTLPYLGAGSFMAVTVTILVIGFVLRRFYPRFAARCRKFRYPVAFVSLAIALAVEFLGNRYVFRTISKNSVEAAAIFVLTSVVISALLGFITRRPCSQITALAIETGLNSGAMTSLLLTQAFKEPDADIAQTVSIAVSLMSQTPFFIFALVYRVYKWCRADKKEPPKRKVVTFADPDEASDTFLESEPTRSENIVEKMAPSRDGSVTSLFENGFDEVVDTKETNV